jgi:tetratricopeptide (TPR) repeat protein
VAKPDNKKTVPVAAQRLHGLSPGAAAILRDIAQRLARGELDAAERALPGALALAPTQPETLRLYGLLEHRRGRHATAAAAYAQALAANGDDALTLGGHAELLADMGRVDEALALLRRACALTPRDADAWLRLGTQLDRQGLHGEAIEAGERLLALKPGEALARILLGRNLQALGRIDEASQQYRKLIATRGPRAYQAWFSLVDLKTVRLDESETRALEKLANDVALPEEARMVLGFALGKVYEDAGRLDAAYRTFTQANARRRRNARWDAASFSRQADALEAAFAASHAGAPAEQGGEVIFVVGLPRSSTTLIEQVLAAHPQVEGASELPDLPAVIAAESKRRGLGFPLWCASATPADWTRLGQDYLARTARWRTRASHSTDKLPSNWMLIGAIRAMLPGARIIDCRRDALETCWSCYKQLFAPGLADYSYHEGELAAYWRDYDRVCRGWAARHPQHVRVQTYEQLLAEPDAEIRALLAFCGLSFDPLCLDFHKAERSVRTPSSAQVRQPLRRDTARAAAYGDLLAALREPLRR